jgi:hypothetical protein
MKIVTNWYRSKKEFINNSLIIIFLLAVIIISIIPIHYYCSNVGSDFSQDNSDWGDFGDYYNGIVSPFLALINILVLIKLTIAASRFNKKSLEKQLIHSTCKEYQNKINDLTFEFFENLELFKENSEQKYFNRSIERLLRIKFFVESFITETEPLLSMESPLKQSKEKLNNSIDDLIKSNFSNKDNIQNFFDEKSEFIKTVFNLVNK